MGREAIKDAAAAIRRQRGFFPLGLGGRGGGDAYKGAVERARQRTLKHRGIALISSKSFPSPVSP
ncbi:hypothetical protein MUK42_13789 [Musa troglodytarum]|uniref:Uncharacterized protein n=1 Tax=Musa troglodytarum TaxID=320322 RepID=A0A9E7I3D1_9LILI|nr:hypothetical protein MUK42_13789 [Musa troglodytarum]